MMGRVLFVCAVALACVSILSAQVDVLTANYDNNRTNANLGEFVLNKANVNPKQFGKLYTLAVDGEVYAQPLYLRGVTLTGGVVRDVLYVATMNNSVYAFDAGASTSTAPIWSRNFGPAVNPRDFDFPPGGSLANPPVPGEPYTDILSKIGILGTPVIDRDSSTLYAVHYTFTGSGFDSKYAYYLHALDLVTGAEKFGGPVAIQASVPGTGWEGLETSVNNQIAFDPRQHLQRPGLLLLNGTVYVAFGSHGDQDPWHGWIMAYDTATLQQSSVLNTTPNDAEAGSIWQSGRGLAADAAGNIYCATGNGSWDGKQAWSQSVLRLTSSGGLRVTDYFTPDEWSPLNGSDADVGSSGPVLIPGSNLLYTIGKEGELWLLDQTNLGHKAALNSQVVQSFEAVELSLSLDQSESGFFVFNTIQHRFLGQRRGPASLYVAKPSAAHFLPNAERCVPDDRLLRQRNAGECFAFFGSRRTAAFQIPASCGLHPLMPSSFRRPVLCMPSTLWILPWSCGIPTCGAPAMLWATS